jgi:hemoglobin
MSKFDSLYEAIGGAGAVRELVEKFYPKVKDDPLLSPLFPEDINPVMERQYLFLSQFFGGPALYSEQFGHAMMRGRHLPFPVTPSRARAWLTCMSGALAESSIPEPLHAIVLERLSGPAFHFVNTEDPT